MLAIVMHHGIIQRIDPLEIFRIQRVLGADPPGGGSAEISLKQLHHGPIIERLGM